jgi:predicted aldo/keto reductase-like oxidoreductase
MDEAVRILHAARDAGVTFYDTARAYSDSEEKLGRAFADSRSTVLIATKTHGGSRKDVLTSIETSLRMLRTDHVDLLQLHNPKALSDPSDPESAYAGLVEARAKGLTRFIGITNHSIAVAREAVKCALYDTVQFPLSLLASDDDLALIDQCRDANVGLIAMKALSGGLITNVRAAFAFLRQFGNVVPIWGIQRMSELQDFVMLEKHPPVYDQALKDAVESDRAELSGSFCRGCGYCLPCPQAIEIPTVARMSLLLRRAPWRNFVNDSGREKMLRIRTCIECGACAERCPYGLDTPALIRRNLEDYEKFYLEHVGRSVDEPGTAGT